MAATEVDEELDLGDLADSAPAQALAGFDPRDIASGASAVEELPDEEEEDLTPEQVASRAVAARKEKERLVAMNAERKAKLFQMRALQDREEAAVRCFARAARRHASQRGALEGGASVAVRAG